MMRPITEKRKYSHNYNDKILIKFGREEINIKAKHPHEPIYAIIVPRVEYWSQVMALSKTQTEALVIPFRRMFKNKLKFARSAPNAILDNPYIYGYRDFYDNQIQAKITDFCIQLNDNGLLGKITEIRLKSLQDQLWTSRPLLEKLPYNRVPHTQKNNYILNMLLLCYNNNISLQNLDNNIFPTIKGGRIPLEDVVDNAYYSKHRERLREKNILFLDQIISSDKSRFRLSVGLWIFEFRLSVGLWIFEFLSVLGRWIYMVLSVIGLWIYGFLSVFGRWIYMVLSVIGLWIYRFQLSVIRRWIYGFRLSVIGRWIYGFRLSVLELWIYGLRLSVIGIWIGIGCDILGLWIGFHFELILNRSGFHFEFLVGFSFGLLLNGFLFRTFIR
ncbi:unnamed protein product [Rhizophagus irregularis]|nr:unnamed protein product [Rhizophagus irregularis]CAB4402659.1 unnamed protein product [Rhizophagus irregularis]